MERTPTSMMNGEVKMSEADNYFDDKQKSEFSDRLAILLSRQTVVTPPEPDAITKIESREAGINRKAIGYIYGFIDSALQFREQKITDIAVGLPILFHVIRELFPGNEGRYITFLMDNMEDPFTVLGMLVGGQQYNDFIQSKGTPTGLARFILGG